MSDQHSGERSKTELFSGPLHSAESPAGNLRDHTPTLRRLSLHSQWHLWAKQRGSRPVWEIWKTATTRLTKLLRWSALFMPGFLGDTSSWFQSGPCFLQRQSTWEEVRTTFTGWFLTHHTKQSGQPAPVQNQTHAEFKYPFCPFYRMHENRLVHSQFITWHSNRDLWDTWQTKRSSKKI